MGGVPQGPARARGRPRLARGCPQATARIGYSRRGARHAHLRLGAAALLGGGAPSARHTR
eukprot:3816977-Prymnesium_polylepis.1